MVLYKQQDFKEGKQTKCSLISQCLLVMKLIAITTGMYKQLYTDRPWTFMFLLWTIIVDPWTYHNHYCTWFGHVQDGLGLMKSSSIVLYECNTSMSIVCSTNHNMHLFYTHLRHLLTSNHILILMQQLSINCTLSTSHQLNIIITFKKRNNCDNVYFVSIREWFIYQNPNMPLIGVIHIKHICFLDVIPKLFLIHLINGVR